MGNIRSHKIRMVALDLDGTTLRSDGSLSEYNYEALMRAHEAGIHIVAASGRPYAALPKELLDMPFLEYAVSSNGAGVYDVKRQKAICVFYMEKEAVRKISQIVRDAGAALEGFIDGVPYSPKECVEDAEAYGATAKGAAYIRATRRPVDDIYEFMKENEESVDCIDMVVHDGPQKEHIWKEISEKVEHVYVTSSISYFIEVTDERAGKASGVKVLADKLGIRQEEIAAFGNAENDMDMLRWAGIGVAVANSPEHVCQAADEVTESNEEDGVGRWIYRYLGDK